MDLLHAAESGRLSIVKQLISEDKSLIRTCQHKNRRNRAFNINGSAIHYACRSGHLNIVKYLLEQNPNILNDLDAEHWTPLHYACYNGHINIVKLLLEYNPKMNIKDSYLQQIPIEFAMYRQFEDIVYLLDPKIQWTRRSSEEIFKQGNVPIFRKGSNLFLGRYVLNENHIKQIELFRNNSQLNEIELNDIQDIELNNLKVRIQLTHNYKEHLKKTLELTSINDINDDKFLRSSTISTNEYILVFDDQNIL